MNILGGMSRTITSFTRFRTSPGSQAAGLRHAAWYGLWPSLWLPEPFVRHVTDHQPKVVLIELQEVVEVPSYLLAGW